MSLTQGLVAALRCISLNGFFLKTNSENYTHRHGLSLTTKMYLYLLYIRFKLVQYTTETCASQIDQQ